MATTLEILPKPQLEIERKKLGLTQKEFAQQIFLSIGQYRRVLTGKVPLKLTQIRQIHVLTGLSAGAILYGYQNQMEEIRLPPFFSWDAFHRYKDLPLVAQQLTNSMVEILWKVTQHYKSLPTAKKLK